MAAGIVVATMTGCDQVSSISTGDSSTDETNSMTPDQSRAQVIEPANEIVAALDLPVVEAYFWHSPCSDDGKGPFRGKVAIWYPLAASFEESEAQIADMVQRLQSIGWTADPEFRSHSTALKKNNVVAVFGPQNASTPNRGIDVYGECRDVTTTRGNSLGEPITLD